MVWPLVLLYGALWWTALLAQVVIAAASWPAARDTGSVRYFVPPERSVSWHAGVELCARNNASIARLENTWEQRLALEVAAGREVWLGLVDLFADGNHVWVSTLQRPRISIGDKGGANFCLGCSYLGNAGVVRLVNCASKNRFVLCETRNRPVGGYEIPRRVADVSTANGVTCVVTNEHRVRCFGRNDFGQLGTGLDDDVDIVTVDDGPERFKDAVGLERVTEVCVGGYHVCAVQKPGAANDSSNVFCWGRSDVRSPLKFQLRYQLTQLSTNTIINAAWTSGNDRTANRHPYPGPRPPRGCCPDHMRAIPHVRPHFVGAQTLLFWGQLSRAGHPGFEYRHRGRSSRGQTPSVCDWRPVHSRDQRRALPHVCECVPKYPVALPGVPGLLGKLSTRTSGTAPAVGT